MNAQQATTDTERTADMASPEVGEFPDRGRSPGWVRVVVAGGVALALLLLGASAGLLLDGTSDDGLPIPHADSVDVGFSQDMSVHHQNAVQMAAWARDVTADPAVRQLAYDIESGQTAQIGQLRGWLLLWGAPLQPSDGFMRWMTDTTMGGMDMGGGPLTGHPADGVARMPGMATSEDLARLRATSGTAADALFLQLMLRHHEGGAGMLRYATERAQLPEVRNLAGQMLTAQTAESEAIRRMLADRGTAPLPS